ncbi:uncharacterized protein An10g00960 [Aspergillus niger]|uniref:Contig An10c0050, genomic contig n=2 Tax=Aspergillus niger TaxID=5061 RepID=A2QV45_ASPNC|nr:uncharacterized protein An10g00960 [Aspergillus niger]CAK40532.1 unnamed protein product [Aspergillus niger]
MKDASEKFPDVPEVLFIPSNGEDTRGVYSSKALGEFYCTLADRFGRDREFYSTTKDENGMTPLHYAARLLPAEPISFLTEGREERQKWVSLLKGLKKDELNKQDEDGRTPVSHAAEAGNKWAVDKLIEAGADPYQCDKNGRSPLSWAAQFGRKKLFELLSCSEFSDDKDNQGWTPCHYFLQYSPQSQPYSFENDDFGILPLIWKGSNTVKVRQLLGGRLPWSQVPPDLVSTSLLKEPDVFGFTLLSRAVQLKKTSIVEILLTIEDVDIVVPDRDGKTPLWRAVEAGSHKIAELLWDTDDVTLRLLATSAQSDLLEWLVINGYPLIRCHGPHNETVLHIILDIPNIGDMENLLEKVLVAKVPKLPADTVRTPTKADTSPLEKTDSRGLTPLALAKEKRLLPIVKLFLRWRAKVDPFKEKADWFSLLRDCNDDSDFEKTYRDVSFELLEMKNNILVFDFHRAEAVTPEGCLIERSDMLQHLWLHNRKQNWIASLQHGLYHNVESYAYSRVHIDSKLSEVTCVLSAEFPNPDEGFFKRHSPFHSEGITSHKCWCISWTRSRFPDKSGDERPVFYSSTISHGQMPRGEDKFLQQYIIELLKEWSLVCDEIETHVMGHCTGNDTSTAVLITNLADDSRYLATIQKALQDQTKGIQKAIDEYRRVDERHLSCLGDSEEDLKFFKSTINDRLDKQHERVRDLRQMEFARLSVEETVFMRRISLITFIFLPLMFASQQSLFGMNVNALQNNPDWRWYIVFGAASLFLTYALWKVSDQNIRLSQIWSEIRARRAMKNKKKDCEG